MPSPKTSLVLSAFAVVAAGALFTQVVGQMTPQTPTAAQVGTSSPQSSPRSSSRSSSRVSVSSIQGYSNCYYLIYKTGSCYDASQQRTPYSATQDMCKRNAGEWCNALPNAQNNPNGFCDATGNCIVANSSSFSSTVSGCAGTIPVCNGACSSGYRCGLMNMGCTCFRIFSSSSSSSSSRISSGWSSTPSSRSMWWFW